MKIHLGGGLNFYDPQKRVFFEIKLAKNVSLSEVLEMLHIPKGELFIVVLNGEAYSLDQSFYEIFVQENDTLELYPPIGGG